MSTTRRRRRSLVRNLIPRPSSLSFLWNSKKKLTLLFAIFGIGGYQMPNILGWLQQQLTNGQTQISQTNPYGNNPSSGGNGGGGLIDDLKSEITNAINKGTSSNSTGNPPGGYGQNNAPGGYGPGNAPVAYNQPNPPPANAGETIHIGSFNIQVFGEKKLENRDVVNVLAQVVRTFDIVAIQEIRSVRDDVLPRFLQQINATGRHYDFIIGPRMGRTVSKEQYAFIFDTSRIEVDRRSAYAVGDPTSRMQRAPFVAHFRVRGPDPREAFTFKLVNVHTDPDETVNELNACAEVVKAVFNDGSGEDDVILLGDLNVDDQHFGNLGRLPGIACVIFNKPTNARGTKQYDNIVFNRQTTVEYTGRSGVYNLIQAFGLTMDQAILVSDHFPIWAEFSIYEGGPAGRFAGRSPADAR